MGDIEYRILEPGDERLFESAESIYERSWGRSDRMPETNDMVEWAENNNYDIFMAFDGGEPAGAAMLSYGKIGEFSYDAVDPDHQRNGIGSGLCQIREEAALEEGCTRFFGATTTHHTGSQKVYERNGFTPTGIIMQTDSDVYDEEQRTSAVSMVKHLEGTGPKDIHVPENWRSFVGDRIDEIPGVDTRYFRESDVPGREMYLEEYGDTFIVNFGGNTPFNIFGSGQGFDDVLEDIEGSDFESKQVYVDLSDHRSKKMVQELEDSGFRPSSYFPHWLGPENNDYIMVQKTLEESSEAELTKSSLDIAEKLDLVKDKNRENGHWKAILG